MKKLLSSQALKAFANDKLNISVMAWLISDRIESIARKEKNTGYQHFLFFISEFSLGLFL